MVPEKDIETVESLFEQRTKVELWWKGLYAELNNIFADFRVNTAYLGADEFVTCQALHSSTLYNLDGLKIADVMVFRCLKILMGQYGIGCMSLSATVIFSLKMWTIPIT